MCGIAGIVSFDPRRRVDESRLRRMLRALRHRGPDGEGTWIEGPIGLGHRRLAIVDVAGGRQPMPNEDGGLWIVCNGEIYNHAEQRKRLAAAGHPFRTRSDTETILHLYEEEGEGCVERLQGMFAFALWDASRGRLLLARDRLGIKPLYVACTEDEIVFASEIKAILEAGPLRPAFNARVLPEFLATRFVAGEETFFRGVRKILPGRILSWSREGGLRGRRYWRLPARLDGAGKSLAGHAEQLRAHLGSAVRSHLMGEVPVGLFLSGGLDSSGIASLMAAAVDVPVRTFAVGFDEPGVNEFAYARLVARRVGALHRERRVSAGEFFAALPRLIWHEDEPLAFTSGVPLYFLSALAREDVKVVLTGEGADELFLGYNRYRVTAWNERLSPLWDGPVPAAMRSRMGRWLQALPAPFGRYAGRSFLCLPPGPRGLFCENFSVFPEALRRALVLDHDLLDSRDPHAEALRSYEEAPGGVLDRMSHADLQTYLVELLMKQDRMSMAASIESRVPYLDHELVEYAAGLPGRFKLRAGRTKAVLRRALAGLVPPAVLRRRKMGFPVPLGRWLRGRYWPVVEEFVLGPRPIARGLLDPSVLRRVAGEHRCGVRDHGDRLWLLLNLEIWQRIFVDREDSASLRGDAGA